MQSRRGLASIITSAILLTTVVLLGTGVVVWGNSSLSSNQRQFNDAYSINVNKINENILFEKIWFGGTGPTKFINITMNNQSPAGVNVTKIQLSTSSGTIQCLTNYEIILSKKPGSMQSQCTYLDNILTTVQITTSRGSVFSTEVFPP